MRPVVSKVHILPVRSVRAEAYGQRIALCKRAASDSYRKARVRSSPVQAVYVPLTLSVSAVYLPEAELVAA